MTENGSGRIAADVARHAADKSTRRHNWGDEADPSAGYSAWLLRGGDQGRA